MGQHTKRIFSGIQPTNGLTLGNYLGAMKRFVEIQEQDAEAIYCVVDLHAITQPQDPVDLRHNTRELAAAYLASGIDPSRSILFNQSAVAEHAELSWILGCTARVGWMNRMTQFKDKAGKNAEAVSLGLYSYPALMAADILLYHATHVPVGDDQKQHVELTRDIAIKFNNDFKAADFFPVPEPLIDGPAPRVMSLRDATKKMSKSDPSDQSRINIRDDSDTIVKKIKKATSDSEPLPSEEIGLKDRPEARNLVSIYAALSGMTRAEVLGEYGGQGFGVFKPKLAELAAESLSPISTKISEYMADITEIDRILADGAVRARAIATPILAQVYDIVGFLPKR